MSRRGRLSAGIVSATLLVGGLGGCARLDAKPVQVAAPLTASDCVVGSWKQTEGWQRIETEEVVTDLRLITGGRQFTVNGDGTARFDYATPTTWKNTGFGDDLEVLYVGTVTLTYTAKDGTWTETADGTKLTTTLTLNGATDVPRPGAAGRNASYTYVCDDTNLILTGDAIRSAYRRV